MALAEGDDEGKGDYAMAVMTHPPAKKPTTMPPPYIVGKGLPVVPPKLVAKIQIGELIDMAELLKDNIEAERRQVVLDQHCPPAASSVFSSSQAALAPAIHVKVFLRCLCQSARTLGRLLV